MRPGRVAGDPDRLDADLVEVRLPVAHELDLVHAGRGPVERVEERSVSARPRPARAASAAALVRGRRSPPGECRRPGARLEPSCWRASGRTVNLLPARWALQQPRSRPRSRARPRRCRGSRSRRAAAGRRRCREQGSRARPSSSRSEPSSRACGSMSRSVRRISCATGTRLRRPVARSITGASRP